MSASGRSDTGAGADRPLVQILVTGASEVLTCAGSGEGAGDPTAEERLGRVPGAAVAIGGGRILAVGSEAGLRASLDCLMASEIRAGGGVVAPGFVDAHTHLVFGGSRVREYALGLTRSRAEVQALGIPTGIMATVEMTRAAGADALFAAALPRLDEMLAHGSTTVESKTGYALEPEGELELLEVNRRLGAAHEVDVVSTFMAAHDFPPGLSPEAYVDQLIDEMIPRAAESGLARFNDVFCDEGYYTVEQARRILEAGAAVGLAPKIHADQYAPVGAAALAAELGAASADHLNFTPRDDLRRLAEAGVTGVLMPLIDFAVRHPRPVRAREWVEAGLPIALGTDLCPGGYAASMPLALQFACRWNGLSPAEALVAATAGGAAACGLADRGSLAPGALADVQVWDVSTLEEMVYRFGHNPVRTVIKRGKVVV